MTLLLYAVTVLIWGTTWIAISLQNGPVDTVASVFYRFSLAGITLFLILLCCRKLQKISFKEHIWCALQGMCLFCFNFICFYTASAYMTSGLISIIFSLAIFFNAINNRLFWGILPEKSIYFAGIIGITGLTLLFWQELSTANASMELITGIGFSIVGTYLFSLGNMISVRHSKHGISTLSGNAYGMNYGAILLLIILVIRDTPLTWDSSPAYVYSLLYLAIPGSVIGFTTYLSLVKRIGANQAAFATVLFPAIALTISSIYEHYSWSLINSLGLVFILVGNALALNLHKRFSFARIQS